MSNDQQQQISTENKLAALDDVVDEPVNDIIEEPNEELNEDNQLLSPDLDSTEEEDEEEKDDEEEVDDTVEDIDPNDVELQVPVKMKELLAKYPNIKKDFPELIAANFREKEYAEVFPTVEDAKEAVEKVATLDKFQELVFKGDTAPILEIVKKEDPNGFDALVNNYLPNLQKVDPNAYTFIIRDTISKALNVAFGIGKQNNNEDLQTAARMIHDLMLGNARVPQQFGNVKPAPEGLDEVKKERAALETERYNSHIGTLETRMANSIKSNIAVNIDPKNNMTGYVKKNAINDCYALIDQQMKEDKRFQATVKALQDKAKKNSYNESSMNDIRKLVLGRAKYLMKEAVNKIRTEALKGISTRDKIDAPKKIKVQDTKPEKKNGNSGVLNSRRGMSTFDKLNEA